MTAGGDGGAEERAPIAGAPPPATRAEEGTAPAVVQAIFRREGDYWTIVYDGATFRLRDLKGLHHLDQLLRHPGRAFHSMELVALIDRGAGKRTNTAADAGKLSSATERARVSVSRTIADAIRRISSNSDVLSQHLRRSVRTGIYCSYNPGPPIDWRF